MADNSAIEWTDASWNPIRARNTATGAVGWFCTHASEGCRNCYAEGFNDRLGTKVAYLPQALKAGQVELFLDEDMLTQPLRWKRPRRIFVGSMTDLFADFVPDEWLDRIFAVMALSPQHTFQLLTKRPERMRAYFTHDDGFGRWGYIEHRARKIDPSIPDNVTLAHYGESNLPNVWLGVSVEDQKNADQRIPILLDTPAAVRWISAEPLLGPIDLTHVPLPGLQPLGAHFDALDGVHVSSHLRRLDWVVVGGESGKNARPMHPAWARRLRDQCAEAGVSFLFKQWGEWQPVTVEGDPAWDTIDEGIDPATVKILSPRESCLLHADGRREDDGGFAHPDPEPRQMLRIGKKAAGRHLDGRLHDAYPEPRV